MQCGAFATKCIVLYFAAICGTLRHTRHHIIDIDFYELEIYKVRSSKQRPFSFEVITMFIAMYGDVQMCAFQPIFLFQSMSLLVHINFIKAHILTAQVTISLRIADCYH